MDDITTTFNCSIIKIYIYFFYIQSNALVIQNI